MITPNEKEKFLEILEGTPLISIACRKAGISKTTIYRWRNENRDFADKMDKVLEEGCEAISDRVESVLIKKALSGERWGVQMWLESNRKKYIKPRMPAKIFDFDSIYDTSKIIVEIIEGRLTKEKIKEINEEKEKAQY